jgi:xylulokinase
MGVWKADIRDPFKKEKPHLCAERLREGRMKTKCYMMGVDIGSGGCKVTMVEPSGFVAATHHREYPTYYPQPGWAEQEPEEWYHALKDTLHEVLRRSGILPKQIASIAVGAATHTLVLLDGKNEPLRPAILWRDKRTIAQVERLRETHGKQIFDETLHAVNVNWTLPYLVWIRECEPEIWRKARKILMPKDYIRYKLTGALATDWMDAHGTLLFNVPERRWSDKICTLAEIPKEMLPPVYPPETVISGLSDGAAKALGLLQGTPVVVGTTDQASEAFGAGAVEPGQGIIKLATAGNVAVVTDTPHPNPPRVYAYYHIIPAQWYTLAGTISCAVCYRWLRDALCREEKTAAERWTISEYQLMDQLAKQAPVGCEGLIFHPHLQGAIWDPYLKADFLGITSRHGKAHFVRSVLEGVAFSLNDCVQGLDDLGVVSEDFRIIGGGASSAIWRQIVCDVIGKDLIRPKVDDSSFGTALVGGLGVGIFQSPAEAVGSCVEYVDTVQPDPANHQRYCRLFEIYRQMSEDLSHSYKRLHDTVNHL